MTELRKIAMQFVSHHSMTTDEFALAVITEILLHRNEGRAMHSLAEMLLSMAPAGGDGW